jgi:hypothetical protein
MRRRDHRRRRDLRRRRPQRPGAGVQRRCASATPAATATWGRARSATTGPTTPTPTAASSTAPTTSAATGRSARARAATTATTTTGRLRQRLRGAGLRRRQGRSDRGVRRRQQGEHRRVHGLVHQRGLQRRLRAGWSTSRSATTGPTTPTTPRARPAAPITCAATGRCTTPASGTEECDDGAENGPGKACNALCMLNVCGDGDSGPASSATTATTGRRRLHRRLQARGVRQRGRRPGGGLRRRQERRQRRRLHRRVQGAGLRRRPAAAEQGRAVRPGRQQQQLRRLHAGCKNATCGDSLIQDNVEQCDDGANNGAGKACKANCAEERLPGRRQGPGRGVRRRQPEQRRRLHQRVQAGDLRRRLQAAGRAVRPRQQQQHGRVHAAVQAAASAATPSFRAPSSATTATPRTRTRASRGA